MNMTNKETRVFIERAIALFDLLWLRAWRDLVSGELTSEEQLAGCHLLLKISEFRVWWLQKRAEWQQKDGNIPDSE